MDETELALRIAEALERIADALERQEDTTSDLHVPENNDYRH